MSSVLEKLKAQAAARRAATAESQEEKKDEQLPSVSVQQHEVNNTAATQQEESNQAEVVADSANEAAEPAIEQVKSSPVGLTSESTHPLKMEMAELQAALEQNVPGFANKLREIHVKLRQDPAIVTLLSDEEIGVIVAGLEKHTNVQIVAPAAIKASKSRSKEPVSASDL